MTDLSPRVGSDAPGSLQDALPPSRAVRWLMLAGVILLGVALYFRWGLDLAPVGSGPAAASAPAAETPLAPTR
ncbi:MAG: hypothetical protein ACREMN_06965 [Gemmatimonadales bacterium]